ncbi:PATL5 [Linum grandiflorum]
MDQQLEEATALQQFKQLVNEKSDSLVSASGEISIWGVTLQPDINDDRTDVILRKFLRVRHFRVQDAFNRLSSTIQWRKDFHIDELLLEDEDDAYSNDLERAFFVFGQDKTNHPVCYTVFEVFQDDELYQKLFSDEAKKQRFLKWRILFMEKAVRKLDFSSGGVSTMVHVVDMKNSPGPHKTELNAAFDSAAKILSANYPDFFEKHVLINAPWWRLALINITASFMTQRVQSKLVSVGPSKSKDTLLTYVEKEKIPTRYDGLIKRDGEFGTWGASVEVTRKREAHGVLTLCYQLTLMDLQPEQTTALQQFKQLIEEKSDSLVSASDNISIWGVTLQPDAIDDRTDVILLKFLRFKHFKVQDAFNMLFSTIQWRKDFCIDELLLEDEDDAFSNDLERAFFVFGEDKENRPVCYTVFEVFQDDELYRKLFSDEAKRQRFLEWRIMLMEKTVRKLDFRSGGTSTMVHVMDLKNSPGHHMTEMNEAFDSVLKILSDHYPGFFEKQIVINVPWWRLALINIINPFAPEWVKKKFVFVGPSKSSATLLRYVNREKIPARCEVLTKRDGEFGTWGGYGEVITKREAPDKLRRRIKAKEQENMLWR